MRDEDIALWVGLCKKAIGSMQTASAGPTRSGKQVQVRATFTWKGKGTVGYLTFDRSDAAKMKDGHAVPFRLLLSGPLRLEAQLKKTLGHHVVDDAYLTIRDQLVEDGFEKRTESLRKELSRLARESVRKADAKMDEVEIANCRMQIPKWFHSALKAGMTPDELHDLVNVSVVENVLKS